MSDSKEDKKLLQIREIIFGDEIKSLARGQEAQSEDFSKRVSAIEKSTAAEFTKVSQRIDSDREGLQNQLDKLKSEMNGLRDQLASETKKNRELIHQANERALSRVAFSHSLNAMAEALSEMALTVQKEKDPFGKSHVFQPSPGSEGPKKTSGDSSKKKGSLSPVPPPSL